MLIGFVILTGYCPGYQTMKSAMGVACRTYGGEKKCVEGLEGEPEVKRPLGISRHV
jgi:hypothetical protein